MIELFKSKVLLRIKGKNPNRFIKRLSNNNINLLNIKFINDKEVLITIYKEDFQKVIKQKSIYEVLEEDTYGYLKIKKVIYKNKHLIIALILGYILLIVLTHVIFDIEVIHSNKEIRSIVKEELKKYGIEKYSFKKSYNELSQIKESILNDYPDKIEWIEIETIGTKYVVRIEEREIVDNSNDDKPRSIVASKDAVIKKVSASSGTIELNINDYVKKGEVIVNGNIMLNEEEKGKVKAEGKVYGEVWYVIKVEYPFAYYEEKENGNTKSVYVIKFLSHDIELTFNKYKTKKTSDKEIFTSNLLPIKLVKQTQKETVVKNEILTFEQALAKAEEKAINQIEDSLDKDEYIIKSKYLKSNVKESTIEVEMFFSVYENITSYEEIE